MWKKKSKLTDQTATGQVGIKKRSKVPGVMITQYVEKIPDGKSHPDFTRKPIALTIQEGKFAFFKALVIGDPEPTVTWGRNNGDVSDTSKYVTKYDPATREHLFEMANVKPEQADTYKCFAANEFGRAVVTVVLNVIEVGFKKAQADSQVQPEAAVADFKSVLKRKSKIQPKMEKKEDGEIDPRFWELLISADKKDYESLMLEFGVTDFRFMLKTLNEIKKEREEEQAQFIENLANLKPIEVGPDGCATFSIDMDLIEQSSRIFLYKDGVMIPYSKELGDTIKHSLKIVGRKYQFSIRDLFPDDAGLYQVDVEDVNVFSTDFKIPMVDFLVKIQECKAMEREDAVFECVLSQPFGKIMWVGKNLPLEAGDKYDIEVSEDKLIHRLIIKDVAMVDKGIYAAVAGIKSCNAFLVVEADKGEPGKKKQRKTTRAGGAGVDLTAIAQEQAVKNTADREVLKEKVKAINDERAANATAAPETSAEAKAKVKVVEASQTGAPKQGPAVKGSDHKSVDNEGYSIKSGLSDVFALRGKKGELVCEMSHEVDGAWFKDGEKLSTTDGIAIVKDGTRHTMTIHSSSEDDTGVYHIEAGGFKSEAKVTVGELPAIDADDLHKFSKPVTIKVGQNASWKMPYTPQDNLEVKWFKDGKELKDGGGVKLVKEVKHSRLLLRECLRSDAGEIKIQLKNPFGTIEATSRLIVLDKPGPPEGPVEILETTSTVIELQWGAPKDDGGSPVTNYIIERQQLGQTVWKKMGDVAADKTTYRDRNVVHGKLYIYNIYAVNPEGTSDALQTEETMAGVLIFAGRPGAPKVVSASKTCINLKWEPPEDDGGIKIDGYQLEKRKKDTAQWIALNPVTEPIEVLEYAVKDVVEGAEYEFRVSAINVSGAGEFSLPSVMVTAKNPNMRPTFKDPEDFMVIRAGNSVRIKVLYEAEPPPEITWMKDNEPVSSFIQIINTEGCSQLVIPSTKRSDSGNYTIVAKNKVGEASFDIEVLVTDEPKPPGAVELEQIVHGKVIVSWEASPDQELDNRLYYMVAEHDSSTRMWHTVADRIFDNSYTANNIMPGREYHFKIYAKNDMGMSDPSMSPTWGINSNRIPINTNTPVEVSFEKPPSVLVPLKMHSPPKGFQMYMTCAIRGCPTPSVTWHLNNVCINGDSNYYITNSYGVCSMYILRVRPKDAGEYKVVAVNSFGKAECSTKLVVKD
ncbi:immunoglobulin like and fibronectin type III domain containing 1, tandem duplicate 4 [Salmo salar]|uniref:immunoglobulin like and fibronectin type III domain containing 1, tandem duplicate 4 n=1 Tax=Salmo salar TaxID=8030 RepID=UPI00017F6AF9|nr:immunoglobulin like and fibronectin type III domain containing 1, tandem duplicate 4 [Salmo salar]ACH85270.1 eEF1A2 binding protein-like [Salmo salar]|eukprot:NP_001133224.1 eEF1A2 binding protein-like [Salmo salar]